MPLVSWFTQPQPPPPTDPKNFSSYYMYDTDTKKFCRIRLELGRDGSNSHTNTETNVAYKPNRAVGFSADRLPSAGKGGKWTVNDSFELSCNGKSLQGPPPNANDRIYDATVVTSPSGAKTLTGFHSGNPVTKDPKLPPGIQEDHLTLLAQDAIITGNPFRTLTGNNATEDQLAKAIQDQVVRVLGKQNFSEVNDDLIKAKLLEQAKSIAGNASSDSVAVTKKALAEAKDAESVITEQITEGETVPNEKLETAVSDLGEAITNAQDAISGDDVEKALVQIEIAQQTVTTAIQEGSGVQNDVVTSQLDSAEQSLNQAREQATNVQEVQDQYKNLTGAENIDDYMSSL
jgi:hypothetical protein